jgi:exopolysaccharide biosynthesis polyprenyl glycosylphosphotransferase
MTIYNRKDPLLLFIGDIIIFYLSLWLTLVIRYRGLPTNGLWAVHLIPFSIIFVLWLLVFYVAGLYEKRTIILKHRLPSTIFSTQITNSIIAVLFFYFIPYYGITPKTNLFIYLLVSFVLVLIWRLYGQLLFGSHREQPALLIGTGNEVNELFREVNTHSGYALRFIALIDLNAINPADFNREVIEKIKSEHVSLVVIDFKNEKVEPFLASLYNLMFSNVVFVDMHKIYEDVFDRVPLSLVTHTWFLENVSRAPKVGYDVLKRLTDIIISVPFGLLTLLVYPFVIAAIKMDDGGPVFIAQSRIGQNGKIITTRKFRTMSRNETDLAKGGDNQITKVGAFFRRSRIDELPQIWSVIRGDQSLIGPRPELPSGVQVYEKEIPYYGIRHLIKPGLSGWAQIYHDNHPHHGFGVEQTKEKLSYDLYYIKNRSFLLDLKIALKTINKLLSIGK